MPIENKIGLLERFADNNMNILPNEWLNTFKPSFGINWKLHDFQQKALKNAMVVLFYYFHKDNKENEVNRELYRHFKDLSQKDKDNINKSFESYKSNITRELQKDFEFTPEVANEIHPLFFKQMCFWMATGSGKTLVIIKMIEILSNLMKIQEIPIKEILISSENEAIIKQITEHIKIYNIASDIEIELIPLKKFDKQNNELGFNKIKVYYTTSRSLSHEDQVSKKNKDGKRINYESVYNNGNWYVFLDEAHKGTEDSKTQAYFQLLASNGFLFNFSATFTEPIRKLTTVYNMNLDKFINAGYGKQIKVIGQGFNTQDEQEIDKQISILQSLILLTAQKMSKNEYLQNYYHNPLLLVFAHSINSISKDEKTDLKEFFHILHDIINGNITDEVFTEAKNLLLQEIRENQQEQGYTIGASQINLTTNFLKNINADTIAEYILYNSKNSKLQSVIEFYKIGKDKSEVAIKLKTADKPFALLKFSDAHKWIEEVLPKAEEVKAFDNIRNFSTLNNNDNPYSMLLGSRMFVEGWDSNRPNLIHFIGLGKNEENTKLVLQAIGRGVRIEPVPNQRKRNNYLSTTNRINIDTNIRNNTIKLFKDDEPIILLETLFVFATSPKTMASILTSLKNEKDDKKFILLDKHIHKTPIKEKPLLIPEYDQVSEVNKQYQITQKQLANINSFLKKYKKVFLLKDISANTSYISKYLEICQYLNKTDKIQIVSSHPFDKLHDEALVLNILQYFTGSIPKFKQFREMQDDDIIHYKYISVQQDTDDTYKNIVEEIARVMKSDNLSIDELKEQLKQNIINIDEYTDKIQNKTKSQSIKKLDKQYYQPTLFSGFDYTFKNAIDVESEITFINQLCEFIKNGLPLEIAWWYFAKINQHHDKNIYIPYVDKYNKEKRFYPDFIFWIKLKDKYKIVFIDPKGLSRTEDPLDKINGFKNIFKDKFYPFGTENRIEIELYYYNNEFSTDKEIENHRIDNSSINKIFE